MKPFNLKKALAGHPLVTRKGIPATSLVKDSDPLYPLSAEIDGQYFTFTESGTRSYRGLDSGMDLFLSPAPAKPRPKSETRKNVERVRAIMGKRWTLLATIGNELQRRFNVYLPEQSVGTRVRDLRKDEYGGYDIRKKQVGKGLYAYKNFGRKGAVK